jgi:hypothetical protein
MTIFKVTSCHSEFGSGTAITEPREEPRIQVVWRATQVACCPKGHSGDSFPAADIRQRCVEQALTRLP